MYYFKIGIAGPNEEAIHRLERMLDPAVYCVEFQSGRIGTEWDSAIDLLLVILPRGFAPTAAGAAPLEIAAGSSVPRLYVLEHSPQGARRWAFAQGAADVMVWPFSDAELSGRIDTLILEHEPALERRINEPVILACLKRLLEGEGETIEPVLDPASPLGHLYPRMAEAFGGRHGNRLLLEKMAGLGLLRRQVFNRVRTCPVCADLRLNYREVCPKCASIDIVRSQMIHHFACGLVAPAERFRHEEDLACPKCAKTLRHIGLDYERPLNHFICQSCEFVFAEARVQAQCLRCAEVCEPSRTVEQTLYQYTLTPLAREAVRRGSLEPPPGVLAGGRAAALGTREQVEHALTEQFARQGDPGRGPFCLLLVRIGGLAAAEPGPQSQLAAEVLDELIAAVGQCLRADDLLGVWDEDKLAVVLPETPVQGALVVIRRMRERVRSLAPRAGFDRPSLAVALVGSEDGHVNPQQMTAHAMEELRN